MAQHRYYTTRRILILIALILAGESIFFLPFVLPRIFRPTLLEVFQISNFELGTYFSLYGIVAMFSYFLGGPLADKYPSKNLISIALWATSIGGMVIAHFPFPNVLAIIYPFWGFTTIFLFWAALIRATREWGEHNQSIAFGLLEGGRGLSAALIGSMALLIFALFMPEAGTEAFETQRAESFKNVLLLSSLITFAIGVFVWFVIPRKMTKLADPIKHSTLKDLKVLVQERQVWRMAIIIVCAYVGYKITDDVSLYANQVLNFNEVESAAVGNGAIWLRPIFALLAGYIAHKINGPLVLVCCFALMAIGGLLIYSGLFPSYIILTGIIFVTMLAGIYGIRAIYFAVMKEAAVPLLATGSAVGIISVLGYTPDVFMSPFMGYLLDHFPGEKGHELVFLTLAIFALIGLWVSYLFKRDSKTLLENYFGES